MASGGTFYKAALSLIFFHQIVFYVQASQQARALHFFFHRDVNKNRVFLETSSHGRRKGS